MCALKAPSIRVYLHLTRNCNLRCRYCYGGEKRQESMSLEVARKAVDFFGQRTNCLVVQFFGGEPLLEFPLLKEIVRHAEAKSEETGMRLHFELVTNGVLYTQEVSAFCREHSIATSLSFDGNRRAQDKNRVFPDGSGSFDAVARNFEHLRDPRTHVVCVVHPDNLAELQDSFLCLLDHGFSRISLSPDYTHPDLAECLPEIADRLQELARIYLERSSRDPNLFLNVFDLDGSRYNRERCRPGQRHFSVAPDGRIYPCTAFADHERMPIGDIDAGFDPERLAEFSCELEKLEEELRRRHRLCPPSSFCHIGCGCTNLVTTGSASCVDPVVCRYGRVIERVRAQVSSRSPRNRRREYF